MLNRALRYKDDFDTFASRYKDLRPLALTEDDWVSVNIVSTWLVKFHRATTQMLATKQPMLSSTHAVFRGLQDQLKAALCTLPDTSPPQIKKGILNAHRKLSDYYYKFNQSPFYTWAARKYLYFSPNYSTYN
ncbi:hypothetical protein BDQ17DRAFT_1456193 [Cyathus striatus]|nr:hypothetical protein BDQ17DRAFT_1456193 [Cyathus striatus]